MSDSDDLAPDCPWVRCPKHNETLDVESGDMVESELKAFVQAHRFCGDLEVYDGENFLGVYSHGASLN